MFSKLLQSHAKRLLDSCREKQVMLATAESCTGGLIAALLTEIPGSSTVVDCGFVTYSDASKIAMLGVPAALIKRHGAVSTQVAKAMAEGALKKSKADLTLAVTGIAGPGGGSKTKPVGLVYIAVCSSKDSVQVKKYHFKGGRQAVRNATVAEALALLKARLARIS